MSHDPQFMHAQRSPFRDETGEAILRQVEAHWDSRCDRRNPPKRTDLNTGDLGSALAHCFFLERVTPTVARFRMAGQAIDAHLGMEPRGMPISAIFTPPGRQILAPLIFDVCEKPAVVEIPLIAERRFGLASIRARLLMMPLYSIGDDNDMIFGSFVMDGGRSSRSLRFDIDADEAVRKDKLGPIIRTIHEVSPAETTQLMQFMTADPEPTSRSRPARLKLVVDNT